MIASGIQNPQYSGIYRQGIAEHCDATHSLEDIVYQRNVPYFASVVKMISEDYLSRDQYPFLLKPPHDYEIKDTKPIEEIDQEILAEFTPNRHRRLILVIVGGLTYTELHHLRSLSKLLKQKLMVVSTSLLSPQSFITALSEIGSNGS